MTLVIWMYQRLVQVLRLMLTKTFGGKVMKKIVAVLIGFAALALISGCSTKADHDYYTAVREVESKKWEAMTAMFQNVAKASVKTKDGTEITFPIFPDSSMIHGGGSRGGSAIAPPQPHPGWGLANTTVKAAAAVLGLKVSLDGMKGLVEASGKNAGMTVNDYSTGSRTDSNTGFSRDNSPISFDRHDVTDSYNSTDDHTVTN